MPTTVTASVPAAINPWFDGVKSHLLVGIGAPDKRETPSEPFGRPSFRPEDLARARPSRVRSEITPVNLLSDFGSRRRIASLAALMLELETTLTDAAIVLFERLTGRLFTRSRNSQDRSWSASKTQAGRLIRLFGGAIDAMVRAREDDRDPFDVLDEEIGWDRLVASREEIAALGDLATQDPLSLATQRYAQLRRFAPAFLDAFEFDAPAAGHDLQAAVTLLRELNRTGKRTLPDIVPMPFPSQHWRAVILHNATPQRRIYETAVVATLRDRLRAGDVWVAGSQDYRRFDAYLVPLDDAQRVLGDSALDTDGPAWLTGRRERLHDRLREVRAKLVAGRLDGVRLEKSRLKITPYDPLTPPAGERLDRTIDALMPRIRIRMLCCPARSPRSASSRLLGKPAKSSRASALSSSVSRRTAWSANPWNARTRTPSKNRRVFRSLKLRITGPLHTIYVNHHDCWAWASGYDIGRYGETLDELAKTPQFTVPAVVNGKRRRRSSRCRPW